MGETVAKYLVGIDVGSTTVKACAIDANTHEITSATYMRHHAHQLQTAAGVLQALASDLGDAPIRIAVTGSGGKELADALGVPYVQEVIANSIAVATHYPEARVAIELGGQDAKMIFFEPGFEEGTLKVADMRMNGSCAGGTGAFLDEIASLLKLPVEKLDDYASAGTTLYSISGRCGVFAKTDIQPLINQGAAKEDIALSTFHAVAKQTLGGLAQGLDIIPPVIFEGGPLTFNPKLVEVFKERLQIEGADVIVPEQPEIIVARGAALALQKMFESEEAATTTLSEAAKQVDDQAHVLRTRPSSGKPFFETEEECTEFRARHAQSADPTGPAAYKRGDIVQVYLGIDSGSTTTKFAVIDEEGTLVDSFYANNEGEPLDVAKHALCELARRWDDAGVMLDILGCATTGYGELLFAKAFHADCHVVETVAHALAAARYVDDATFILDIGGQDMKAIFVENQAIRRLEINEACSSGCGSFIETFAKMLGYTVADFARIACEAKHPYDLGTRCTVFMNSKVKQAMREGTSAEDISAGFAYSVIKNCLFKVLKLRKIEELGDHLVVQGGTFKNLAVVRALELLTGKDVRFADIPELMGAYGCALYAREQEVTNVLSLDDLLSIQQFENKQQVCPGCPNHCTVLEYHFSNGQTFYAGNNCEKIYTNHTEVQKKGFNQHHRRLKMLFRRPMLNESGGKPVIGIPRALGMFELYPFWHALFR